ncbi:MAG: hypothetical protein WEA24_17500 [Gemmatimonadota bacterium]
MTELVLFAIASLAVPVAVGVIFLYLRASFELLDLVRSKHPELWQSLGKPERVYVQEQQRGFHTIQPLMPWLSWVWSGSPEKLSPYVALKLRRARSLLVTGAAAFGGALVAMLVLMLTAA